MHTTDEALEEYLMGRLPEKDRAILEEHLLSCGFCRSSLVEAEKELTVLRQALNEIQQEGADAGNRPARASVVPLGPRTPPDR